MANVRLAVEAAEKWAHRSLEACLRDIEGIFPVPDPDPWIHDFLGLQVPDPDPFVRP